MSESDADKMSRVRLMASGSATWDLSRNDIAALKFVLVSLDAAESALAAVVRERDDLQRDVASQNAAFAAGYADGQRDMATRLTAVEAERDEARNARDHYMDVWNEQCAHVREACEMLGVDPEQIAADSWTLRDYAARVYRRWIDAERADSGKAHRLAALGGELFAARERAEQADTARREWEVRAATSYAAGRAAGLREAMGACRDMADALVLRANQAAHMSTSHRNAMAGVVAVERAMGAIAALAPPAAETERTETIFGCRTCPASTPGWTDGRFASPGWGRIDHIDGPNAICPVCAADPTSLDCLREEYPDVTPAAEPRDEGEVSGV